MPLKSAPRSRRWSSASCRAAPPKVRAPSSKELNATAVLCVPIEEASAKIRTGPPQDDAGDYALGCWAGVVPLQLTAGAPQPDPRLRAPVPAPVLGARGCGEPSRS